MFLRVLEIKRQEIDSALREVQDAAGQQAEGASPLPGEAPSRVATPDLATETHVKARPRGRANGRGVYPRESADTSSTSDTSEEGEPESAQPLRGPDRADAGAPDQATPRDPHLAHGHGGRAESPGNEPRSETRHEGVAGGVEFEEEVEEEEEYGGGGGVAGKSKGRRKQEDEKVEAADRGGGTGKGSKGRPRGPRGAVATGPRIEGEGRGGASPRVMGGDVPPSPLEGSDIDDGGRGGGRRRSRGTGLPREDVGGAQGSGPRSDGGKGRSGKRGRRDTAASTVSAPEQPEGGPPAGLQEAEKGRTKRRKGEKGKR